MDCPPALRGLRVALVHDYLNQAGGAEKVVEVLAEMFPGAPIYTSVYDPAAMPDVWRGVDVRTTFMQRLTPRMSVAKKLLPLYPTAFESLDFSEYDLVLSSTTAFAKGIITKPHTCHVCYCNNPTRFLWMPREYLQHERLPGPVKALVPWIATPLRVWDYAAAQRVDYFVAGSHNAARRIAKYYRRQSDVVQAPIDARDFEIAAETDDYFLVVSRLQSYKRIDIAIEACNRLGLPLHILGTGPDLSRLESLAGPTVTFLGRVPQDIVRREMARCRAFILPGEEDYGLTPIEAQASGRPVIAYGAGGALETVVDGETGAFFRPQTVEALVQVLERFEDRFDPAALREHALQFDRAEFTRKLYDVMARRYTEFVERIPVNPA